MSTREEIGEGKQARLEQVINEAIKPYLVRAILSGFEIAILKALSKEGAVLKVERELPRNPETSPLAQQICRNAYQDMLKWHNDSLEPLIKEEK